MPDVNQIAEIKPTVLYHASDNTDIEVFEPRDKSKRSPEEGKRVFATPDLRVAAMFLAPVDDSSVEIGKYNDEAVIVINGTAEDFIANDKAGAIYTLPSRTFTTDASIGMGTDEWVSSTPVVPISKEIYSTAMQAMRELGITIYFVNGQTFRAIQQSDDNGWSIIKTLKPYSPSS